MDRGMLNRATSSDDSPTPGYMYGEIAKMTHSSIDVNRQIIEFLLKRLPSKNAHVKRKTLVLIKHLARSGRTEFKRDMCRNLGPIKDCLQFTGPPDPLRGDEAYQKVREAAKEAVEAVTCGDYPQQQQQHFGEAYYNNGTSTMGGMGPPPSGGETYQQHIGGGAVLGNPTSFSSTGTARSGYEGFGSAPLPKAETYTDKALGLVSAVKEKAANAIAGAVSGTSASGYIGGADDTVTGALPGTRMPGYGSSNIQTGGGLDSTNGEREGSWSERANYAARRAGNSIRNFGFTSDVKEDFSIGYASNRGSNPYTGDTTSGSYNVPSQLRALEHNTQFNTMETSESQREKGEYGDNNNYGNTENEQKQSDYHSYTQQQRPRGAPGGSWGRSTTSSTTTMSSSYGQSNNTINGGGTTLSYQQQRGSGGGAKTDGEYERTLVTDLCSAGGTRSTPPPEKLASFLDAAKTLEAEVIGPNVLDLLDDEKPWQVKCKALALVEALAIADGCDHHKQYFADVGPDLVYLANKPPVAVQRNARKMLTALGIDTSSIAAVVNTSKSSSSKQLQPHVQDADYNDVVGISTAINKASSPKPEKVEEIALNLPNSASAPDLLGGYGDEDGSTAESIQQPIQQSTSLFEDLALNEPAIPRQFSSVPITTTEPNLFGDMDVNTQPIGGKDDEMPSQQDDPFAPSVATSSPLDLNTTTATPILDTISSTKTTTTMANSNCTTMKSHGIVVPPTPPKAADPFSELSASLGTPAPAPIPIATGPAFIPSQQHSMQYQHQQQMQMNIYMQQQRIHQSAALYPNINTQRPVMIHHNPNMPPPNAMQQSSGFDFMASDNKAKQADSFAFVNDLMNCVLTSIPLISFIDHLLPYSPHFLSSNDYHDLLFTSTNK